MKVSKKMKILTLVSVVAVGIVSLACASMNNQKTETNIVDTQKWQAKAPQLFSNIGYKKLIESRIVESSTTNRSQQALVGTITNPFGIRDDVLEYILLNIPESNTRATIAAIKMAYYDQAEIGVTDDKQINVFANKAMASVYCSNISSQEGYKFDQGYNKLLRNTKERFAEQERIESLLSGHVISADFGINSYDFKEQCDHFLGIGK